MFVLKPKDIEILKYTDSKKQTQQDIILKFRDKCYRIMETFCDKDKAIQFWQNQTENQGACILLEETASFSVWEMIEIIPNQLQTLGEEQMVKGCLAILQSVCLDIEMNRGVKSLMSFKQELFSRLQKRHFPQFKSLKDLEKVLAINLVVSCQLPNWDDSSLLILLGELHCTASSHLAKVNFVERADKTIAKVLDHDYRLFIDWLNILPKGKLWIKSTLKKSEIISQKSALTNSFCIEIDQKQKEKQLEEITNLDLFKYLEQNVHEIRKDIVIEDGQIISPPLSSLGDSL